MRSKESSLVYNLDERIPNVLFVGSGIDYHDDYNWHKVITAVAENKDNVPKLQNVDESKNMDFQVPNTILAYSLAPVGDEKRHRAYIKAFDKYRYDENERIKELLELTFDAILTTNYTYEFEYAQKSDYINLKTKERYAHSTEKDGKYLIHTYNKIDNSIPIWHIHGELRRKSSMIFSHDEYAHLIQSIMNFNTKRGNDYEKYHDCLRMKSWIDYFLTGNIYFLGYSLDYSEFDIWWLLSRRLRENAEIGNVYFYDPINKKQNSHYKHEALKMRGVNVETFGCDVSDDSSMYNEFYSKAIEDIKAKLDK